ncbi:MAG: cysteine desulfurase family protein [Bryobacteraceae bacterium]
MNRHYFDHNATTPVSPEVLSAFTTALAEVCGNASSVHHFGQQAKRSLESARRQVAAMLGADGKEVVFLSGGTEADNLAVLGAVRAAPGERKHMITSAIEHPAVLGAAAQLEREGVEVTRLGVDTAGVVDPDNVGRALRPHTVLISVMHANNETGVLQPVARIARIAREAGVAFHSDGVQAAGKIPLDVGALGVDLYAISGHKFHAPKGTGALFVRKGLTLAPLQHGGHHERDRRPGTENVPGAVALAAAAENAIALSPDLRDRLERSILDRIPGTGVNGGVADRTPNTSNMWFDGVEGEAMVIALDLQGFAVSTGAACSSGAIEPSHVLTAMGLSASKAKSSLRFSLGRANTAGEVDALVEAVAAAAARLRKLSPAYAHA